MSELPVAHYLLLAWADWVRSSDEHWIAYTLRHRSFWDFMPSSGRQPLPHMHKTTSGLPTTNFRLAMVEQWMSGDSTDRGLWYRNPKLHEVICAKYLGKCCNHDVRSERVKAALLFPDQGKDAYDLYQVFVRAGWRTLAAYIGAMWDDIEKLGYLRTLFGNARQHRRRELAA